MKSLIPFLPEYQRPFAKGQSFDFLCQCVDKFLSEYSEESKQTLVLAKENFEHYCQSHPDFERVQNEIHEKKRIYDREEYLRKLYEAQK